MWKLVKDIFLFEVDFSTWPLNNNEILTTSNSKGSLSVFVYDSAGNDVTSNAVIGSPSLSTDNIKVQIMLSDALTKGFYTIEVVAPTTDDEILTEKIDLYVK